MRTQTHNVPENTDLMGQGRDHKQTGRGRNNPINRGTKAKGKRVVAEDTEIGSKPGSQI